jgi:DNA-binding SARP family transcriptional activator/energy-coupling factor transporter ATP-binding protein EcfA2
MPRLKVCLLGGFRVELETGRPVMIARKKSRALLAILALRPGHAHARDSLTSLLWANAPDEQARHSLRQELHELRRAFPPQRTRALLIDAASVALDADQVDVDVALFERLAADETPAAVERAGALYEGDLLLGLNLREEAFEEWLAIERERLRQRGIGVLTRLLNLHVAHQRYEAAVDMALRLLTLDPTQEDIHRTLMQLYARQGRRAAALRQYQVCVDVLQRELGIEPEGATRDVYRELLTVAPTTPAPGPRPAPGARRRVRMARGRSSVDAPLVGREYELIRVRAVLQDLRKRRGHVVFILGEAGLGKSRLVSELTAAALDIGGRVIAGRAYETAQVLAFGPWVDALRAAVASDPEVVEGLEPAWRAELGRLLPEVHPRAGRTTPPDVTRLFEAVSRLLERFASSPLVVVLEDVQWADELTLRLAAFLARRIAHHPVLLVLTAREDLLPDAAMLRVTLDELREHPAAVLLSLHPLSRAETAALVRSLSRAQRDEQALAHLESHVWRVSAGNPLLVLETIRAVHQHGADNGDGAWPLPTRVRELVTARLERLSERARQVVSIASVIGREFDFRLLQHAAALDDRLGAEVVEELVRRKVLHGVGERLDFTHDLVRQVAREALPPDAVKSIHRLLAGSIEAVYARNVEPHYEALAAHSHGGQLWDKAVGYLVEAGRTAVERSAHRAAAGYFEQALAALAHLPESRATLERAIDLRLALHTSRFAVGELARSGEALRDADEPARRLGDARRDGVLALHRAQFLWASGRSREAWPLIEHASAVGHGAGDVALSTSAVLYTAAIQVALGDLREAERGFRRVTDALSGAGDARFGLHGFPLVFAECGLAVICAETGRFAEANAHAEACIRAGEAIGHAYSLVFGLRGVGHAYTAEGRLDDAIRVLDRGLGLCEDEMASVLRPNIMASLGHAYALSGRTREGIRLLSEALAAVEAAGALVWYGLLLTQMAEAWLIAGDLDRARELATRALTHAGERGERWFEARASKILGDVEARRRPLDAERCARHYHDALRLAAARGLAPLVAQCQAGLTQLGVGDPAV